MTPIEVYERLYASPRYESFPNGCPRHDLVRDWVVRNVAPGSSILEVGVGRGRLMRMLDEAGYVVHGTEFVQRLLFNDLKDVDDRVFLLSCEELGLVETATYDCVISSDVIEHLTTEAAAEHALTNMARITKQWLAVTVGLTTANANTTVANLDFDLHRLSKERSWWLAQYGRVAECTLECYDGQSLFAFGKKREVK